MHEQSLCEKRREETQGLSGMGVIFDKRRGIPSIRIWEKTENMSTSTDKFIDFAVVEWRRFSLKRGFRSIDHF